MLLPPGKPRKSRASLRFLASSCIFSGWLTLVVSILFAAGSVVAGVAAQKAAETAATSTQYFPQAPAPAQPQGDLDGIGIPGMGGDSGILGGAAPRPGFDFMSMFRSFLTPLYFISAGFTLLTGIVSCLLFLGLGQACYVLLDLEDQTHQITQTLQLISSRLQR